MPRPLTGVRADKSFSYRDLEKMTAYVRRELKLSPDGAIDPLALFEGLDDIRIESRTGTAIPLRHGVVSLEDSEGYAKFDAEKKVIEVLAAERVYTWLEEGHPRATYFVAHELGHCVLHTDQLVRLARMPTAAQAAFHRGKTEHAAYQDTEWQANAFAGALLMPAAGLLALDRASGGLCVTDIMKRFGVSNEAAGYRLDNFTRRRAELLRP